MTDILNNRKAIKHSLSNVLKEEKIDPAHMEKSIYQMCDSKSLDVYSRLAYNKVGEIIVSKDNIPQTINDIKNNKVGYDSFIFNDYRIKHNLMIDKIINPPKLENGVYKCRKASCKSQETWSYQLQTRGADEPMTNFVTCSKCGSRFTC